MSFDTFDIQGHRGARGLFPENTMPGFIAALDVGVTTLEMDVVISRDRRVVVSHDPWFDRRICLGPDGRRISRLKRLRLYEMPYEEIAGYDAGSLRHPDFPRQQCVRASKPLLAEVIQASEQHVVSTGRAPVFYSVETKSRLGWEDVYHPDPRTYVRLVLDVLEECGVAERAIVQSFDERTLQQAKRMEPPVRLSLLLKRKKASDVDANLRRLGFAPSIYSPDWRAVDAGLIERAHDRGLDVIPWTVNDEAAMKRLRDLGVDGLITDYPDVAVRLLRT